MSTAAHSPELELDLGRYALVRAGRSVRLEKQPMELLILLVEKRGQLVTREEIVTRLWGKGVFLDTEGSINTAIRKIRLALHDNPDKPHVVETVVGKGYRFIAPINVVTPVSTSDGSDSLPKHAFIVRYGLTALVLLGCIGLVASLIGRNSLRNFPQKPIRSIAVLPLENYSGNPSEEYFADGMTDALITDVARISGLRVISRTSVMHYRGSGKTVPQIARELNVDAVIEGSVARSSGRVRITAQLVEASTDRHLWADTYERGASDTIALQDDIARAIARQVTSRLSAQKQVPPLRSRNPEAYDAYLKGLHEADTYTREGLERSVAYFQEAVRGDAQSAEAWAGLARAYNLIALFHYAPYRATADKAEAAALRSIQIDDKLSESHAALGGVLIVQRSWVAAEKELRRSIALNPSNSVAHQSLGYLLAGVLGRYDEGILEMNRALDLDPLSPSQRNSLGAAFYWARRYDDAMREFREVPDGDANTERRHRRMAEIYERRGMEKESIAELVGALKLTGRDNLALSVERTYHSSGYAAARNAFFSGDIREREPRAQHTRDSADTWWLAGDYAMLGKVDDAFHWLDKALDEHDKSLIYVRCEGQFDSLRHDPRYPELLRQLGLD